MMRPAFRIHPLRFLALAACLALVAVAASQFVGAQGQAPNGAGLVVRHGDGSVIYAYVEFEGETISGEELLLRSGLDFVVAPYAGLGTGICAINNEGCPADDCYCRSYDSPAVYWRYYGWNGGWSAHLQGPTSRQLADGDIDGWSWTGGDHDLPPVTIDEIAAITGFDRSPPPTETPVPAPTAVPTETPTAPPAATSTWTAEPQPTETSTPPPPETEKSGPSATATTPPPTATATTTPTASATATVPATSTASAPPEPATSSPPTTTASSGAVIVEPGGTPSPVESSESSPDDGGQNLLLFGGFAVLVLAAGGVILLRNRRAAV